MSPNDYPPLAQKPSYIAVDVVRNSVQFRVTTKQGRTALVVADHVRPSSWLRKREASYRGFQLGVLKEGEMSFQSSEPIKDDKRSQSTNLVVGPVLISRPPTVLPCDVQK